MQNKIERVTTVTRGKRNETLVIVRTFNSILLNINYNFYLVLIKSVTLTLNIVSMRDSKRGEFTTRETARQHANDVQTRAT
jgi:hypothetical protein